MAPHKSIWLVLVLSGACNSSANLQEQETAETSSPVLIEETWVEESTVAMEAPDTFYLNDPGVVFFMPNAVDLEQWALDASTLEGLESAVGNFAYNASIIADSLTQRGIEVHFTDRKVIAQTQSGDPYIIVRDRSSALMGISMNNGEHDPNTIFGLYEPDTWWSELEEYFSVKAETFTPLLDHFKPIVPQQLHVYTSHNEILNQTGAKIHSHWHPVLNDKLAKRARKYRMSFFGYYQFPLGDSLIALVCRVPSISDESAIKLFVWDQQTEKVINSLALAENIWSDGLIRVKDSWITPGQVSHNFKIVQRQREARFENGKRVEHDEMLHWIWRNGQLQTQPTASLSKANYQLKDWASFQEHESKPEPGHLTFVDDEFAWLPLKTGDMTYEHIILELPKPYEVQKEPIANQYRTTQIDTIFILSRTATSFRFYGTPEEYILIDGVTEESGLTFKNGIKIGMPKTDFAKTFERLSSHSSIPDEIRIKSRSGDRIITCYFQSDTLSKLQVTHYIH